jgi:hypothetical protein
MDSFDAGLPIGERVRALEMTFPDLDRRLDETIAGQKELSSDMKKVLAALEQRSASMRVATWFVELLKMALAAAAGGAGVHFFSPNGNG